MIPNIAVILTNAQKRILWVNDDFTHITGYSLPEVVGKSPGGILQGPKTEPEAVNQTTARTERNTCAAWSSTRCTMSLKT